MRDGRMGGPGYGAASNPGGPDWDQSSQGSYHDGYQQDLRQGGHPGGPSYPAYQDDFGASPEHDGAIPGPRSAEHRTGRGDDGGHGPGGPEGPGGPGGPGGSGDGLDPAGQGGGHRRGGRRKPKSRKRKVLRWVAIVAAVAVLGSAGAAYGYYEYLSSKIRKGERSSGKTNVAKPKANSSGQTPMNIMILGSDTRADPEDAKLGGAADATGARADVIMIAHLSADRSNMSVVSIPRDTRVDIPECTDPKSHKVYPKTNDIINASLSRGGAGCTLAAVQNLTGLYIDHWLTIDFAGVVKMADVVGGVDVCVKENVDDHATAAQPGGSHLHLTAGTHTVKGNQALQWLRTRHAFGSDAGRSKAQHMYMSSLIRKLRSQNLFTNPAKLNKIATTAMSAFEVSSEIGTPKKLYDLGMQLKTIPPNRITLLTMPRIADPQDPNAHYLPAPDASTVWSLMRNDVAMDANGKAKTSTSSAKPTTSAPSGPAAQAASSIPVTVVNGTAGSADGEATPGRAGSIAGTLKTAGFTRTTASQTQAPRQGTVLNYPSSGGAQSKSDALSVAKALKIPASNVKASTDVQTITLTIGSDWKTGTDYAKTLPKAGSVPSDADVINGADTKGCMDILPTYQF
ncbi:transcriptional attenuator, LytR family [Actinacidiphila yanglinensis]|uniref:Transcriptional attenuator, LytR family n=1 Tax=Actinacidiphila yanglinensis TaxID=310779 RepID=A0A1H6E7U7_9ACTN|nr:LCP family protein [Actinacidiphila yanglinensis]SEG93802.1 transcriptional attenuator, LytR family [Actinacidiphila yanglinensis]